MSEQIEDQNLEDKDKPLNNDKFEDLESLPQEEPVKKKRGRTREEMLRMNSESKLTSLKRRELVKRIESLVLLGESKSEIFKKIEVEFGIDKYYYHNHHVEARRNILRQISTNIEDIRNIHVMLYEKIFKYFDESDYSFGKAKALQYKERLLGLHREDTFVEINNENNLEIEISDEQLYDTDQLSDTETNRLKYLKNKLEGDKNKKSKKKKRNKKILTSDQRLVRKYENRVKRRERKEE